MLMGNRVVVGIRDTQMSPIMFVYAHWGIHPMEDAQRAIIKAQGRWSDYSYANRIATGAIINSADELLNGGVSLYGRYMPESEYRELPVITWSTQTVEVYHYNYDFEKVQYSHSISFEELISAPFAQTLGIEGYRSRFAIP
jgi:hypothetical protein